MWSELASHAARHAALAFGALVVASGLGLPLGMAAATYRLVRGPVLALSAIGRTLPSIALLTLLLPWLGVGTAPAVVALVLLALPPIVITTDVAIAGVAPSLLEAASGLGMTATQRMVRVIVPSALPTVLSGVRTAAVEVIASATLATFIGAGGLGDDIVRALQTDDPTLLLAAVATVAAMALFTEYVFARLGAAIEIPA